MTGRHRRQAKATQADPFGQDHRQGGRQPAEVDRQVNGGMPPVTVLALRGISKRFGALLANDAISLTLQAGEVLALLGENGAGKSTLMSILFGHYVADAGEIEVFGQPLAPGHPKDALAAGIGMVHQHFTLADNLTVLDNVLMGTESLWQPFSRRRAARAKLLDVAQRFGLPVAPEARVGTLSVGERQRVEILKALYRGARILILDEPTAVLTPQESEALFDTLAQMVAQGLSIIFISHKLPEVLRVSHRIAKLRGGRLVAAAPATPTVVQLALWMVGHAIEKHRAPAGRPASRRGLRARPRSHRGRRPRSAAGPEPHAARGRDRRGGGRLGQRPSCACRTPERHPARRRRHGPADGPRTATLPGPAGAARRGPDSGGPPRGRRGGRPASCGERGLERLRSRAFSRWLGSGRGAAKAHARSVEKAYDVRGAGLDAPARTLSGGNMQKLILGRALMAPASASAKQRIPRLIVAHQPTWGLDIGAVAYVQQQLIAARDAGAAVLLISDDLDEVLTLGDRVAVMHGGALGEPRPAAGWTREAIGLAMAGS